MTAPGSPRCSFEAAASIYRDADLQAAWEGMDMIDRKDLRAGDLLFFGAGPDKITHTAMYIGDGEIIHATTHGHPVVQISRLDDQLLDENSGSVQKGERMNTMIITTRRRTQEMLASTCNVASATKSKGTLAYRKRPPSVEPELGREGAWSRLASSNLSGEGLEGFSRHAMNWKTQEKWTPQSSSRPRRAETATPSKPPWL